MWASRNIARCETMVRGLAALSWIVSCDGRGEYVGDGRCGANGSCARDVSCASGKCGSGSPDASAEASSDASLDAAAEASDAFHDVAAEASDASLDVAAEASDASLDARLACPIHVTDVTRLSGGQVAGPVAVGVSVNRTLNHVDERIMAHSPLDHMLLFERIGSWQQVIDVTKVVVPTSSMQSCQVSTIRAVGQFGESINDAFTTIDFWTALTTDGRFIQVMSYDGGAWNNCVDVTSVSHQSFVGPPQSLTDHGSSVLLGPSHQALVMRWASFADDWRVRSQVGGNLVGSFASWKSPQKADSFAAMQDDGSIQIFRSTLQDVWKQDVVDARAGTPMVGGVVGWSDAAAEYLAAAGQNGDLFLFTGGNGSWQATDVTQEDGETAVGVPTRYELANAASGEQVLVARNATNHLIYHWRDPSLRWHAFDLSTAVPGGEAVEADPTGWGAPAEAVAAQGIGDRLLLFEGLECLRGKPVPPAPDGG